MGCHARHVLTGDVCPPDGFRFCVESKIGYDDDADLSALLSGQTHQIDEFISQAVAEMRHSDKPALICWKRSRQPWIALIPVVCLNDAQLIRSVHYDGWVIASLEALLDEFNDDFWFEGDQSTAKG
jgi:hypothetical protein